MIESQLIPENKESLINPQNIVQSVSGDENLLLQSVEQNNLNEIRVFSSKVHNNN